MQSQGIHGKMLTVKDGWLTCPTCRRNKRLMKINPDTRAQRAVAYCRDNGDGSFTGMELLGNRKAAPGILAARGYENGSFRCPGHEIPFGMFLPLAENAADPGYLGLVFD